MTYQCYTSRASLRSTMIGGLFISPDGTRHLIPDRLLNQAELLEKSCLLRLSYSFCTIEIAGKCLDIIFEDVSSGKLGAVQAASLPQSVPGEQLWVTNIVTIARTTESISLSGHGCSDA